MVNHKVCIPRKISISMAVSIKGGGISKSPNSKAGDNYFEVGSIPTLYDLHTLLPYSFNSIPYFIQ